MKTIFKNKSEIGCGFDQFYQKIIIKKNGKTVFFLSKKTETFNNEDIYFIVVKEIKHMKKGSSSYERKEQEHSFLLKENEEKLTQQSFYEFCLYFDNDQNVRKSIRNKSFEFNTLSKTKKTISQIKKESISFNIKKINNGELDRLRTLKVWKDTFSNLKEKELKKFLTDDEISTIQNGFNNTENISEKKRQGLIRSAFRWCIRGLDADKAVKKELESFEIYKAIVRKAMVKKSNR